MLVDGCRVERNRLVVRDVSPALSFAREEFRVETPGNDGVGYHVVAAVDVIFLGNNEELTLAVA